MEKVSQLLTSLSPFQKPSQAGGATRTTPTRVLPWKLVDSPTAEGKENATAGPAKPFIPETAYVNADVGVLRRKAYTPSSFAPESQTLSATAPRTALSEMPTNSSSQTLAVRPSPKTSMAGNAEDSKVSSYIGSQRSPPKAKSPLAVADVRLNEILMGIDNLLNGMEAASQVTYSSQRKSPSAEDVLLKPTEPRLSPTPQAQVQANTARGEATSEKTVAVRVSNGSARTSSETFGQASPVVNLPSFPGSPSPIRMSFNPLTNFVSALQSETIVKLQFEEAAAMKDWDRKHSEEFARRLSLGKPAIVPVTPDCPADENNAGAVDRPKAALPLILTPDPPPEPASFADAAFRLDHAAHAAIIALFSERATPSQLNKASVDLNEAIYRYQIETMHFLPPDNSRMRLRAKLMHRITALNMNAEPKERAAVHFPSPVLPAEQPHQLTPVEEGSSGHDDTGISHPSSLSSATVGTSSRVSLEAVDAQGDGPRGSRQQPAGARGLQLPLEKMAPPTEEDMLTSRGVLTARTAATTEGPLTARTTSSDQLTARSSFEDWLKAPMDAMAGFVTARMEVEAREGSEAVPRLLVAPAMPQLDTPGVGLRIGQMGNGAVVVLKLWPNTPAEACGCIFQGDIIEGVDHKPLVGLWLLEVAQMITGADGTDVTLRLVRHSSSKFVVRLSRCSSPVYRIEGQAASASFSEDLAEHPQPAQLAAAEHEVHRVQIQQTALFREADANALPASSAIDSASVPPMGASLQTSLPEEAEPRKVLRPLPVPPLKLQKVFEQQERQAPSQPAAFQQVELFAADTAGAEHREQELALAQQQEGVDEDAALGMPPPRQPPLPRRRDIMMQMDAKHAAWARPSQPQPQLQPPPLPPRQRAAQHHAPSRCALGPTQQQPMAPPVPPRPQTARALVQPTWRPQAAAQRVASGHLTARQGQQHRQGVWFTGNGFLDGVTRIMQPTPLMEISRNLLQGDPISSLLKPAVSARGERPHTKGNHYRVVGPVLETPPDPPAPPALLAPREVPGRPLPLDSWGCLTARRLNATDVVMGPSGPDVVYTAPEGGEVAGHDRFCEEGIGSPGCML